ncbi:hypothetical protein BH10ACT8_BH10ACT8_26290 [soil metagenome]
MGRILLEVGVLAAVVVGLLSMARRLDALRRGYTRELSPPADATWTAVHRGTADEHTEVMVVLRSGPDGQVWDRRSCAIITNTDPAYDKLLYNAMEDARQRATLLNSLGGD